MSVTEITKERPRESTREARPKVEPRRSEPTTIGGPGRALEMGARSHTIYLLGVLLSLAGVLALAGYYWERSVEARDAKRFPMTGQLVDVGGYRLHLNCSGTASPTVLLESGFALTTREWELVQPGVAVTSRVCSYDHAGVGWSESGPLPRTAGRMAEELHTLLERAAIPGPYVLVGHSYGGYSVRMFAALYPKEVVGVVLVDSEHPERYFGRPIPRMERWRYWIYRATAPFGIARILGHCPVGPPSCARYVETYQNLLESTEESAEQVVAAGDFGALPLVVIARDPRLRTATDKEPESQRHEDTWMRRQRALARLSSNSSLVLAPGTSHQVPTGPKS